MSAQKPEHESARYERSDVPVRMIVICALSLIVAAVLIEAAVWGISRFFAHEVKHEFPPLPPIEALPAARPPGPLLTPDLRLVLEGVRKREDAKLTEYRWIDKPNGIVAIPIERAMELIVQRGLPAAASTNGALEKPK